MCEADVYLKVDEKNELFLDRVDKVIIREDEIYLENIFGQRRITKGKIVEMALVEHKIILEKS
ncbi:MAG: CooT family nickel-binding protein [Maledivibacter sp.]|jgi:predicted RNA-binding protein|nr:CooT family nickel-binding protein [Maledivibacter sp.]